RSVILGDEAPAAARPARSPLTSAMNDGTPSFEKRSARTWSVTVLPVPVAPVINPWRLAIPGRIMMSTPAVVRATANGSAMGDIMAPMRYLSRTLALFLVWSAGVFASGTQAGNPMDRIREDDLKADMFA